MKPNLKVVIRESPNESHITDSKFDLVIYWSSFVDNIHSDKYLSLPQIVEANSVVIRDHILDFIDSIRVNVVDGQSIEDSLIVSGEFSFWWLTLPALKRWQESSRLFDLARLFALEHALKGQNISSIEVEMVDEDVRSCIQHFAEFQGASFGSVMEINQNRLRRAQLHSLPWNRLRAFTLASRLLVHAVVQSIIRNRSVPITQSASHIFFDYLDLGTESPKIHHSRFWGTLQKELRKREIVTHWIHVLPEMRSLRQFRRANKVCAELSSKIPSEKHTPLNTIPTLSRWYRILKIYTHVVKANQNVLNAIGQPVNGHPSLCFLPLLRPQVIDSIAGATAVHHCNLVATFEELSSTLQRARFIVYPMENQPWEKTLLGLYEGKTDAVIIGAPHSVVKFWDLRFFESRNSDSKLRTFQFPDVVAINSTHTRTIAGYDRFPEFNVVDVEALRYLGLIDTTQTHQAQKNPDKVTVLVVGDFLSRANLHLISIADRGLRGFISKTDVVYKPHPLLNSNNRMVPGNWTQTSDPLLTIMAKADVVIMTSSASAVIEARNFGKPVILIIDPNVFDYSILHNDISIFRVTNEDELSDAFTRAISVNHQALENFFTLDSEIPRWKSLLGLNMGSTE